MKKWLSLLLVVVLVIALAAGCGTTKKGSGSEAASQAPADGAVLPICAETTDISVFMEMSPQASFYITDYGETPTWQYLESLTNVHVNWQTVADNTLEKFNIMLASGDPCDMMMGVERYYTGGVAAGIDEGLFMELTDVVNKYMPTYKGLINADKETLATCSMADGRIGAIFSFLTAPATPNWGPIVRQDWLDKIGMKAEDIVTYDDYYNMLSAFKTECNAKSPLLINAFCAPNANALVAGYGVAGYSNPQMGAAPFYVEGGTVKYGYLENGFYEYLQMLSKWYADGLFDSDFATNTNVFQITPDMVTGGDYGLWYHMAQIMDEHQNLATDPEFKSIAIKDAVKTAGDTLHFADYANTTVAMGAGQNAIAAGCKNVEVLAKWLDYLYTDEGGVIRSFGIKDETYAIGADGKPHFTEKVLNNPEYGTTVAANLFAIDSFAGLNYEYRYVDGYGENAKAAGQVWLENVDVNDLWDIPDFVAMSTDDALTYSTIYNDIATYGTETVAKFVTGEKTLDDAGWKEFTDQLKALKIEDCIACWQRAYDGFYAA